MGDEMNKIKIVKCGKHTDIHVELCPMCMIEEMDAQSELIKKLWDALSHCKYIDGDDREIKIAISAYKKFKELKEQRDA
jgi:hypothetical protein